MQSAIKPVCLTMRFRLIHEASSIYSTLVAPLVQMPPPVKSTRPTSPLLANGIATLALIVAIVFGTGAWLGQRFGNGLTQKNYELGVIVACAEHPVAGTTCIGEWSNY